jgi:hypothetical protein
MSGGTSRKIVVEPITISFFRGRENATLSRFGLRKRCCSFMSAQARKDAIRLADAGDHAAAQRLLQSNASQLRATGVRALAAEADLLEQAEMSVATKAYSPTERKRLWYEQHSARRPR